MKPPESGSMRPQSRHITAFVMTSPVWRTIGSLSGLPTLTEWPSCHARRPAESSPYADSMGRDSRTVLAAAGIDPVRRPETLAREDLLRLVSVFASKA
jgi:hypothetical protein